MRDKILEREASMCRNRICWINHGVNRVERRECSRYHSIEPVLIGFTAYVF